MQTNRQKTYRQIDIRHTDEYTLKIQTKKQLDRHKDTEKVCSITQQFAFSYIVEFDLKNNNHDNLYL